MAITDLEIRMTIKTLAAKGVPKRAIARQLDLSEGTIRYHLSRIASGTPDGRAAQPRRAGVAADAIAHSPRVRIVVVSIDPSNRGR
ncbi:LuxR C-terminal-related transcriptional regulator [Silanimonas sp.]|uniref:LuxR C-terminal-related transcriptional regulator n=1 Tax=Silanimonas sp. TaxID=1929290 RepID=UPI0022CB5C82|nr:LuxR C-terminal-related transcriptional regulator [Silanimonas sp.]MCZ8063080.1 LuxR C-terminal-related transcriptional regulator [Silanimonas sp.]